MIKLECKKGSIKSVLYGTPIELMAESCVVMESITKHILGDCPKETLDRISELFVEEVTSAMTSAIDKIKDDSDE